MPKYLKIDLIATSAALAVLLAVSVTALTVLPSLTMPVLADSNVPMPAEVFPSVPVFAPVHAKAKLWTMPTIGFASWYGSVLQGHHTASGERFDKDELTAAHRTLPFGTLVRVVDVNTGRSVVVRINDRGVLFANRVIDLSSAAADDLGILRSGVAKVRLEILKKTPATQPKAPNQDTAAL